jgi:hypothetical protein
LSPIFLSKTHFNSKKNPTSPETTFTQNRTARPGVGGCSFRLAWVFMDKKMDDKKTPTSCNADVLVYPSLVRIKRWETKRY